MNPNSKLKEGFGDASSHAKDIDPAVAQYAFVYAIEPNGCVFRVGDGGGGYMTPADFAALIDDKQLVHGRMEVRNDRVELEILDDPETGTKGCRIAFSELTPFPLTEILRRATPNDPMNKVQMPDEMLM